MNTVHVKIVQYKQKSHSGHKKKKNQSLNYEFLSNCIMLEADQNPLFFSFHQLYKAHFPPQHKVHFASNVYDVSVAFCYFCKTTCFDMTLLPQALGNPNMLGGNTKCIFRYLAMAFPSEKATGRDDRRKWPVSCQKRTLNQAMHSLCLWWQVSCSFGFEGCGLVFFFLPLRYTSCILILLDCITQCPLSSKGFISWMQTRLQKRLISRIENYSSHVG